MYIYMSRVMRKPTMWLSGFRCQFGKGSLTKVHYPKLYNMAHHLALNVLLLPKDHTIIFISYMWLDTNWSVKSQKMDRSLKF